jgi:hypothetical protein
MHLKERLSRFIKYEFIYTCLIFLSDKFAKKMKYEDLV